MRTRTKRSYFSKVILLNMAILSMGLSIKAADITTNLISHWPFNESAGDIATNSANATYNATLATPNVVTWLPFDGCIGGAVQFSGTGAAFNTPFYGAPDVSADNATISFWVKANLAENTSWRGLIFDRTDGNRGIQIENGIIMAGTWVKNSPNGGEFNTGITIPNNQWTFVCLTVSPTTMKVKARVLGEATYSSWEKTATFTGAFIKQFAIGHDFWGSNFVGILDDMRVYSRTLADADIDALFSLANVKPTADAGVDKVVYLPYNNIVLRATDAPKDKITERKWELIEGTLPSFANSADSILNLTNLTVGEYKFRYSVKDINNEIVADTVMVVAQYIDESMPLSSDPQRVIIINSTIGKTIGTSDGVRLRGVAMAYSVADAKDPYETKIYNSKFYGTARNMGFNAVRCFVDQFDVYDEAKTLESLAILDTIVNMTSKYGMQLMLNAGNIGYFRNHTPAELKRLIEYNKIMNGILTTRYKNRTHVIFEQQNEPTYNASSLNGNFPTMVQDIADCYNLMRSVAPDSHISLFTFMESCGYSMVEMVDDLVLKTTIDWTKTTVAFHGYKLPPCPNIDRINEIRAKYPVVQTEFWPEKNMGEGGYGTPYEMEGIEDNEISWFTWWLHTGETGLYIYEPIFADLESIGKMWDFTTIDLQEPIVNCGNDTIVFLPQSTITLESKVTDNGTIVKYDWVLMKQPENANVIFTQNNEMAELSNMTKGSYHFRLFVWDNDNNYSYDDITVVLGNLQNIPGKIEAEDYSAAYGIGGTSAIGWIGIGDYTEYIVDIASSGLYSINVSASAAAGFGGTGYFLIDGEPASSIFTVTTSSSSDDWGTFLPAYCSAQLPAGRHTLRWEPVTVKAYNIDCFTFTKTDATFETSPDQTIKLPINSTVLTATVTDPSGIKSYKWKVMSGEPGYILSGETTNTLTFSNLIEGEYVLSIEVTTNSNIVLYKNIKVTVQPCIDNPIVSAGNDKKFALPTNSTDLTAVATATNSEIESYLWEKISGSDVTMSDPTKETLSLTNLIVGYYTFKITVISKNNSCVATDEVMVKVFPATSITNSESMDVNIYPNPARTSVTIERDNSINSESVIVLSDISGKLLKKIVWRTNKMDWDISQFNRGVYVISISSENKITHKKLIIE